MVYGQRIGNDENKDKIKILMKIKTRSRYWKDETTTKDEGHRAKDRGQDQRKEQMTTEKRQKTKDNRQRTNDKRQKSSSSSWF